MSLNYRIYGIEEKSISSFILGFLYYYSLIIRLLIRDISSELGYSGGYIVARILTLLLINVGFEKYFFRLVTYTNYT